MRHLSQRGAALFGLLSRGPEQEFGLFVYLGKRIQNEDKLWQHIPAKSVA